MSDWISVEDWMPGNGELVDVWTEGRRIPESSYEGGEFYTLGYDEHGVSCYDTLAENVTHWMPLPEPPP